MTCPSCHGGPVRYVRRGCAHEPVPCDAHDAETCQDCGSPTPCDYCGAVVERDALTYGACPTCVEWDVLWGEWDPVPPVVSELPRLVPESERRVRAMAWRAA